MVSFVVVGTRSSLSVTMRGIDTSKSSLASKDCFKSEFDRGKTTAIVRVGRVFILETRRKLSHGGMSISSTTYITVTPEKMTV